MLAAMSVSVEAKFKKKKGKARKKEREKFYDIFTVFSDTQIFVRYL
jgi:hypothetical protein